MVSRDERAIDAKCNNEWIAGRLRVAGGIIRCAWSSGVLLSAHAVASR